jgi:ankyrin repeat domain-containing protein 50
MSDPLSVLSGAAGLVSLGITICQGLITYYQAWDAWEDDVRGAMQDVEDISKFLGLLKARIDKLSADQADIINQAHTTKARITEAVKKLEDIHDRVNAVSAQNGERHKWRNFSRRSLYPFKQSTLRELRDAVRQAREGLTSLLQLLQM